MGSAQRWGTRDSKRTQNFEVNNVTETYLEALSKENVKFELIKMPHGRKGYKI